MATLLQVNKIKKAYDHQIIFNDAGFTVSENQKIGVVGRNGAGKSTLFRLIIGEEDVDGGEIVVFEKTKIGHIRQEDDFTDSDVVLDYLIAKSGKSDWQVKKQASFFQIDQKKLSMKIKNLSGGYQMRVKLTAMFLLEPNLLLLDEPTNYLDLSTIFLLEEYLKRYKGTSLIISHDRDFLDRVSSQTLEVENGMLNFYPRPVSDYLVSKAQQVIEAIKYNRKQDKKIKHLQSFIDRFGVKASKAKQAQSKAKQIKRIKKLKIAGELKKVSIKIPNVLEKRGLALRVDNLTVGYKDKVVAEKITFDIEKSEHIAVLGDNGQGKTTFLRTIANDLAALSGRMRWMPNMRIAYYAQHLTQELNPQEKVGEYLERNAKLVKTKEQVLKVAGDFLFSEDDLLKSISMLSGGERARLCLAGILLSDNNVLLLDEPTNHLDFETIEALVESLRETKATVLFISHNQSFISALCESIIEVKNNSVRRFIGTYEDYVEKLKKQTQNDEEMKIDNDKIFIKQARLEAVKREKERKKILKKIEDKLAKAKKRKEEILKIFIDQPGERLIELRKELKALDMEITSLEEDWLHNCE